MKERHTNKHDIILNRYTQYYFKCFSDHLIISLYHLILYLICCLFNKQRRSVWERIYWFHLISLTYVCPMRIPTTLMFGYIQLMLIEYQKLVLSSRHSDSNLTQCPSLNFCILSKWSESSLSYPFKSYTIIQFCHWKVNSGWGYYFEYTN